jgi:anaerobic selenocysteine-containing dehydrogenase
VVSHRSFCRFCEAACAIVVDTEVDDEGAEQVTRVRGEADHPLSNGYTCAKGRSLPEWHHHPDRLTQPLVSDGTGGYTETGWDDALDDLAARLSGLIAEHGPDSVGVMLATGSAFDANGRRTAERMWRSLGSRSVYTSGSVDTPCKPFVARLMSGFPGLVPTLDESQATLTVLLGINPVVSHGHLNGFPDPVVKLRGLSDGERELWVVDPRSTETAGLATRHLAPRPGTDHVLLAHVLREILIDGADHDYLAAHVAVDDVTTITELVEPYTRDRAAVECDLRVTELDDLVAAVRCHGKVSMQTGTGCTMARAANLTEWMSWVLHIVTGSFDRPGGMWFNPGFLRQLDRRTLGSSGAEPTAGPRSRPELKNWLNEFPCSALADEIDAGNLKALVVFGGNPMRALPDPDRLERSLAALDTLAVIDVVETDTTRLATHVFPSTGQLERADLPLSIDQFVVTLSTQYTPAVVAPVGESHHSWWIFASLGERLGLDLLPDGRTADECTDDDLLRPIVERSRGSWDELVDHRVALEEPVYGWVLDGVLPDGRWSLAPRLLVEQFRDQAGSEMPPLQLIPRRQVRHLNSQLAGGVDGRPTDKAEALISPTDAAASGIADGDMVTVTSAYGAIELVARVTDDVRPGALSVPHGYGEANVTALTSDRDDIDRHTGMVLQSGVAVDVAVRA